MAAHRGQIVAAAAKRFRECGFDGISVADIMKEVGLRSFVSYLLQFLDDLGKRPFCSGCHQFLLRRKVSVKATVCASLGAP
jgi:hypothetical protein